jgi:hypothetical protein
MTSTINNEIEWIKKSLVPLLRRVGFRKIEVTHGVFEAGRDVVFADYDKFGLLRYFGAQVKTETIRAANETLDLQKIIAQLQTAYETPFHDVSTGTQHKLAGVYLIVNGEITEAARQILFNKTGAWLHIVDRNQIEIASKLSATISDEQRQYRLSMFEFELSGNKHIAEEFHAGLKNCLSSSEATLSLTKPGQKLRHYAYDRVLEFAWTEFDKDDLVELALYEHALRHFNMFAESISIGAYRDVIVLENLRRMEPIVGELLADLERTLKIVDAAIDLESPAPGHRLPRVTDRPY